MKEWKKCTFHNPGQFNPTKEYFEFVSGSQKLTVTSIKPTL